MDGITDSVDLSLSRLWGGWCCWVEILVGGEERVSLVGRTTLGGTGLEGGLTWQRWNC